MFKSLEWSLVNVSSSHKVKGRVFSLMQNSKTLHLKSSLRYLSARARQVVFLGLRFTRLTWAPVSPFHPNVAVALSHTGLRVEKRHPNAPLSTQSSVVVVTLLHGVSVVLLTQPKHTRCSNKTHKCLWNHYILLHWQMTEVFMVVDQ